MTVSIPKRRPRRRHGTHVALLELLALVLDLLILLRQLVLLVLRELEVRLGLRNLRLQTTPDLRVDYAHVIVSILVN